MATKTRKKPAPKTEDPLPVGLDSLLTRQDVQRALRISPREFGRLVQSGAFAPPDLRFGRRPRWRVSTINAWIAARSEAGET